MKYIKNLTSAMRGFIGTIRRFPASVLFFLLCAILTSYNINAGFKDSYFKILFSFILGAAIFMVLQMTYERFIRAGKARLIFGGLSVLGALIFYLVMEYIVREIKTENVVRTIVLIFILIIAFIWIPSVKSKIGFSDSFMAFFKGFFVVAFYSGVMFLGAALILLTFDKLIAEVDSRAYSHVLNVIAFIYAPLHFLSLIPVYPVFFKDDSAEINDDEEEIRQKLRKAIEPSKFLEVLISYIIIPVTVVFTLILLLYIVLNISGDFWKDNLMESLLVAYSITVITVYLLASAIKNKPAAYFRMIFPKVLIPVVLFQTVSSILKIGEAGITAGRYYVILFGLFATVSAIIFSIRPNHKTNVIAPILIILALISVFPPTDAFAVSRKNQISRLTGVLKKYDMLKDGKIFPNTGVSKEDRQIIVNSVRYLDRMDYTKDITWLQAYNLSYDFEKTFGFAQYDTGIAEPEVYRLYLPQGVPINISGYDYIVEGEFYGQNQQIPYEVVLGEEGYILTHENKDGMGELVLTDKQKNELIRFTLSDIYGRFIDRDENAGEISFDEAKFTTENENAILSVVVKTLNYEVWNGGSYQSIETLIMIKIK